MASGTRTETDYEARERWPYLSLSKDGEVHRNGREAGAWIAGHLFGRRIFGDDGLRVQIPMEWLGGVSAYLVESGVITARFTSDAARALVTLDAWCEYREPAGEPAQAEDPGSVVSDRVQRPPVWPEPGAMGRGEASSSSVTARPASGTEAGGAAE